MQIPEIIYTGKGKDRKIVITEDLKVYLLNCKDSKVKISKDLHVSRPTLDSLYDRCGVGKRETKKQRAVRKTAEQIVNAMAEVEAHDAKQKSKVKARKAKAAAKDLVKSKKTMLDRLQETVKGKDGQPIIYNGEELTTEGMMDISLINQAKESPQANLYLRAQTMAIELAEQKKRDLPAKQRMIARIKRQRDTKVKQMKAALTDKGVYLTMLDTMLEAWGDAWKLMKIAEWQYEHNGGDIVEKQITAQAQRLERPNQYFETYRNAMKAYNDADQKLRSSCNAYFKLAVGDNDEVTEADKLSARIEQILSQE